MSDSSDDDQDWSDWVEDALPTHSLWDEEVSATATEAIERDARVHGYHLIEHGASLGLDTYGFIRLVNYIRAEKPNVEVVKALQKDSPVFTDDKYLRPSLEDDTLLQVDFDELAAAAARSGKGKAVARSTADADRILDLEDQLSSLQKALHSLRLHSRDALFDPDEPSAGPSQRKRDDDTHYFRSYAANEIHESMLKDAVRTDAYRDFILHNPALFSRKVVLDVGCGTGILSMFAARAGAQKVYAVDASQIAATAKRNVAENGLSDIIQVIHGKVEDLSLPEKVDIIVSEWMGYFLLYESMLDSVLRARDLFLKPGGLMAPSQCSMLLAAADDETFTRERIDYWQDVYGFKMSAMQDELYDDAIIDVISPGGLLSNVCAIKDIHVTSGQVRDVDFESSFTLVASRSGTLRMLCAYFDTFFTHDGRFLPSLTLDGDTAATLRQGEVAFTTGPRGTKTHWAQTLLLLRKPFALARGDEVKGTIRVRKSAENVRELVAEIIFEGKEAEAQVWNVR